MADRGGAVQERDPGGKVRCSGVDFEGKALESHPASFCEAENKGQLQASEDECVSEGQKRSKGHAAPHRNRTRPAARANCPAQREGHYLCRFGTSGIRQDAIANHLQLGFAQLDCAAPARGHQLPTFFGVSKGFKESGSCEGSALARMARHTR